MKITVKVLIPIAKNASEVWDIKEIKKQFARFLALN